MHFSSSSAPLLRMENVSKQFGATRALANVSLELRAGETLALVGENGAGKSTLMKVLSGAVTPDDGRMTLNGVSFQPRGPQAARRAGVAMIYQELTLANDLTVCENAMLGQERSSWGVVGLRAQRQLVHEVLARLGHGELPLDKRAGELSVGQMQIVEIARALVNRAKIIIFDEPTSSLAHADVERLFETIARLRQQGLGVIYISHFLEEVRRACDRYTVLRDGTSVDSGILAETTEQQLINRMAGRSLDELYPQVPHTPGEALLRVNDLTSRTKPRDVSFELRRGEILGLTGLVGAGRTELLRAMFGLDPVCRGDVRVGTTVPKRTPAAMLRAGVALVSEDRKGEGLAQNRSIADNITYGRFEPYSRWGWLNLTKRRAAVASWAERMQIKAKSVEVAVESLSGGNQQKVALARVLHQGGEVLLLDEPTRGIDVGTKAVIYQIVGELAAADKAVLFVSSYFDELLRVCDRIGVISRGRLVEIRPAAEWTKESLLTCAMGAN
ncbi:MAG TPA: sugar ABC transporter ATP-binding protein [Lacipirellulaceae bacterium]|jgi:ribose transport system ATP-binding protein|nr:sugar ABC transporter ATP-binding protein [Lacipirellulaceae bacterium]